jgi:metallo-beta-lactamase family protein
LIPKLVKDGFKGNIYCTPATLDLAEALLFDSAYIQESDLKFMNKKRLIKNLIPLKPLYTADDVKNAMVHFKPVDYETVFTIFDDINFHFTDVGHILGSAAVHIDYLENNKKRRLTFSGDLGRYNTAILNSPKIFRQADIILCESTYGDRLHDDSLLTTKQLLDAITNTCLIKKGKLIIPAFSVGRTQEILYALNLLETKGELPLLNYYVDSPLSTDATLIIKKHKECFNAKILKS